MNRFENGWFHRSAFAQRDRASLAALRVLKVHLRVGPDERVGVAIQHQLACSSMVERNSFASRSGNGVPSWSARAHGVRKGARS